MAVAPIGLPTPPYRASDVFCKGNTKLGTGVITFSLPPVVTCTGSTSVCRATCYVERRQSRFSTPAVRARYHRNWQFSLRDDFHQIVTDILNRRHRKRVLCRLHVSGDFYADVYAWKWLYVMQRSPDVVFWLYTRAWRDPTILPFLEKMAGLDKVFVWYSCDHETGMPRKVHPRVRLAYMMTHQADVPGYPADLCFRDRPLKGSIVKFVRESLVCPAENGITQTTCDKCRICLSDVKVNPAKYTRGRRAAVASV